jgi:hypothetical protein
LRLPLDGKSFGIFLLITAAAFFLSWLVSLVTEARTKVYRDWLYRRVR